MEPNNLQNDYSNAFKLATENNEISAENNIESARNDDSSINPTKKKKKSTKNKSETNLKNRTKLSATQSSQRIQIKNSDTRVQNIIININNNPITTVHAINSQNMPVNNKMNEYEAKKTDPNKFNEINLDNEANQYRLNDKVLDAQQTKFFVSINRLVTSSKCNIIYLLCFICCLFISVLSLIDIFVKLFLMYQVWILVLGIVFLAIFLIDAVFKFMVMRSEYLRNKAGIVFDFIIVTTFVVNFVAFIIESKSILFLSFNFLFWGNLCVKFLLAYKSLNQLLRQQRNVRQNVEEIINFSEIMDENANHHYKKNDTPTRYLNKKVNKFTPAISFIDDEISKNKKEFNLIKQEENKDNSDNN